jgi:hypothetical protein
MFLIPKNYLTKQGLAAINKRRKEILAVNNARRIAAGRTPIVPLPSLLSKQCAK